MNALTCYLIANALFDFFIDLTSRNITDDAFNLLVNAAITSLPEDDYLRARLTDYLNSPFELSDDIESYMLAIAVDENLPTCLGGI